MENENDKTETGRPEPTPKEDRTFVSLGADPTELDAAQQRIAYLTGYKHGMWDVVYIALSFLIVMTVAKMLRDYVTK